MQLNQTHTAKGHRFSQVQAECLVYLLNCWGNSTPLPTRRLAAAAAYLHKYHSVVLRFDGDDGRRVWHLTKLGRVLAQKMLKQAESKEEQN
jgi:hypothetical protein